MVWIASFVNRTTGSMVTTGGVPSPVPLTDAVAFGVPGAAIIMVPLTSSSATGVKPTLKLQVLPGAIALRVTPLQVSAVRLKGACGVSVSGPAGAPVELVTVKDM